MRITTYRTEMDKDKRPILSAKKHLLYAKGGTNSTTKQWQDKHDTILVWCFFNGKFVDLMSVSRRYRDITNI